MISPSVPAGKVLCDPDVIDEMRDVLEEFKRNIAEMEKGFESDPQLSAKIREIHQLNVVVTALEKRRDELMNERNEAIRLARSWKNKFHRLTKAMDGAK